MDQKIIVTELKRRKACLIHLWSRSRGEQLVNTVAVFAGMKEPGEVTCGRECLHCDCVALVDLKKKKTEDRNEG